MLKRRIRKWDLDKKLKRADMLCALQLMPETATEGEKTAIVIRNRTIVKDDVARYWRRKRVRDLESLEEEAERATPTTKIRCRILGPSSASTPGTTELALGLWGPARPLSTTSDRVERFLYLNSTYFATRLGLAPKIDRIVSHTLRFLKLSGDIGFGFVALVTGEFDYVYYCFDEAFDMIAPMLKLESPFFLPHFIRCSTLGMLSDVTDTAHTVSKSVDNLPSWHNIAIAEMHVADEEHPILQGASGSATHQYLCRMSLDERAAASERAVWCFTNHVHHNKEAETKGQIRLEAKKLIGIPFRLVCYEIWSDQPYEVVWRAYF
jgi:hypothetical protein